MDRLSQIRKEISIENGYSSWPELSAIEPKIKVSMLQDEVARRYATEVARHNLDRAANRATVWVETPINGTEFKLVTKELGDGYTETITVFKDRILETEIELI